MLDLLRSTWARNPWYKLLAFVTALSVWSYVQGDQIHEAPVRIAIEWELPADLRALTPPPNVATLRVKGTRRATRRAKNAPIRLLVDATALKAGTHVLSLDDYELLGIPGNVERVSLSPISASVELDEVARRMVRVRFQSVGEPRDGYTITGSRTRPSVIEVEGPRSVIERLSEVSTTAHNATDLRENTTLELALQMPRNVTRTDAVPDAKVGVDVLVTAAEVERTFEAVPIYAGEGAFGNPSPTVADVTLRGPPPILGAATRSDVALFVHADEAFAAAGGVVSYGPTRGPRLSVLHSLGLDVEVVTLNPNTVTISQ